VPRPGDESPGACVFAIRPFPITLLRAAWMTPART
jgi:hypothetical protein